MKQVYLDYSATTPVKDEVVKEMIPYYTERYGNPSSLYSQGLDAKDGLEEARRRVAGLINAEPREIFFTSCGTESDNCCTEEGGEDHEEPVTGRVNLECCIRDECLDRIVCKPL